MNLRISFKSICLWLLYGFVLTGILLYVRFPGAAVKKYCAGYVEKVFPGIDCGIGALSFGLPLTFKVSDVRLTKVEQPDDVIFAAQSFAIRPHLSYPIQVFTLSGDMYDGAYTSELTLKRKKGAFSLTKLTIENLDLQKLTYLQEQLDRDFTGRLTVTGEYSGVLGRLLEGEARGNIEIDKGSMELLQPVLSLNTIDLQKAEFGFQFKDHELQIQEGSFNGEELEGNFSGYIEVLSPWLESEFDVAGDLEVHTALLEGSPRVKSIVSSLQRRHKRVTLPFNVSGSVDNPLFRFGT